MKPFLVFIGRVLIALFLLSRAYAQLTHWDSALNKMSGTGLPYPQLILAVSTLMLLISGLCLLIGYKTKIGIILGVIEIALTAFLFHPFWTMTGNSMEVMLIDFQTKMAICGGLLCLFSTGPGSLSIQR